MSERLHTIIGSRHSKHQNDIPTVDGLEEVRANAAQIKHAVPANILNAQTIGTNKNRTQVTAKEIANTLGVPVSEVQIKDWLNINPEKSPENIKKILGVIDKQYENDPSVKANGYSDGLVYQIQRNMICDIETKEDVDVRPFSRFTANKLYQTIQMIKRNPTYSNLSIGGIHGGRWLETVLYTFRGENMPTAWEGQIRMGEMFTMHVDKDTETGKVSLVVNYRNEERSVSEDDMKAAIDKLPA